MVGAAGSVVAHPGERRPGQDVLMVEQALERAAQIRRDLGDHPERTDLSDGVPLRDADRKAVDPHGPHDPAPDPAALAPGFVPVELAQGGHVHARLAGRLERAGEHDGGSGLARGGAIRAVLSRS